MIGFVVGKDYSEMVFLILFFDLLKNLSILYFKYLIFLGGNCGCG